MNVKKTSIKVIVQAIEDFYHGQQIIEICKVYDITPAIFYEWLAEYKEIALELTTLRIENERMRNLLIDFILNRPFQINMNDKS